MFNNFCNLLDIKPNPEINSFFKEKSDYVVYNNSDVKTFIELLKYYNEQYLNAHLEYRTFQEELINSLYDMPDNTRANFYVDFMKQEVVIVDLIPIIMESSQ